MDLITFLLIIVIILVTVFDFTNGFHDAADMIATAIASRAMNTITAVSIVSFFTFLGPFIMGLAVAETVGNFVDISKASELVGESVVISALMAAISYNLVTWKLGIPSSSSNSLAGGLVGAGLYAVGNSQINWGITTLLNGQLDGVMKVMAGLFVSPFLGFLIGFLLMKVLRHVLKRFKQDIYSVFVVSQYFSVAWLGFSHGANDAQKGMAIIGMMLLASGHSDTFTIPVWSIILCASAITIGTVFGGWSIIKTLGFGIFHIRLIHSVANQLGAALVNTIATSIGAPTSTTQVVTATLIGNGTAEKPRHVHWQTVKNIISGWFLNMPVSIGLGWFYCWAILQLMSEGV